VAERDVLTDARLLLVRKFPDLVMWRNSTGFADMVGVRRADVNLWISMASAPLAALLRKALGQSRAMRFGLAPGSSDLIGISNGGRFTALEAKSGAGRLTPEQEMFLELVRARGGVAGAFWSPEEAVEIVRTG